VTGVCPWPRSCRTRGPRGDEKRGSLVVYRGRALRRRRRRRRRREAEHGRTCLQVDTPGPPWSPLSYAARSLRPAGIRKASGSSDDQTRISPMAQPVRPFHVISYVGSVTSAARECSYTAG
jgi:hypothetical protein